MDQKELYRQLFEAEAAKQNRGNYQGRSFSRRSQARVLRLIAGMIPGAASSCEETSERFGAEESLYAELGTGG